MDKFKKTMDSLGRDLEFSPLVPPMKKGLTKKNSIELLLATLELTAPAPLVNVPLCTQMRKELDHIQWGEK